MVARSKRNHPTLSLQEQERQGWATHQKQERQGWAHDAARPRPKPERPAGTALPELDPVIHERVRLGIVSALAVNESLSFNDLKRLLNTTDGNLSVHARKLEGAAYVRCDKFFAGRVPRTEYRLTAAGRRALQQYLEQMEQLIRHTRQG